MKIEDIKKGEGKLPFLLLSIAECYPPTGSEPAPSLDERKAELPQIFSEVKAALLSYDLSDTDIVMAALLLEQFLEGKASVGSMEIISRVDAHKCERLALLQEVPLLQEKGVVCIEGRGYKIPAGGNRKKYPLTLSMLAQAELQLSAYFLDQLVGSTGIDATPVAPYTSNQDYLDDWFAYVDALRKIRCLKDWELDGIDKLGLAARARTTRATIEHRLSVGTTRFPLDQIVTEYQLDETERDLLVFLLMQELRNETADVGDVMTFVTALPSDRVAARRILESEGKLRSRRLIEVDGDSPILYRWQGVTMSPAIMARLLDADSATLEEGLQQILRNQSIFKLETTHHTLDDVVLPEPLKKSLMTAIKRYEAGIDAKLRSWGIERNVQLKPGELDEAPLLILLSGPSGTGKTFTAGAIANYLGKELLTTDISKLLSCWVGQSEQNVRKMLDVQGEIVRKCPNPPLFFLNECDQFLQNRGLVGSGVSRMYNQMQNLLLEGFEKMRGVLIATTNLMDNIDEAFSRRFHLKLEIGKPDLLCRKKLWEKHLLPTIPRAEGIDIEKLASSYEFTGGQIAVVVRNAAVEAAVRGDILRMEDLLSASAAELQGVFDGSRSFKGALGFCGVSRN